MMADLDHFRRRREEERQAALVEQEPSQRAFHEYLAEQYGKHVETLEQLEALHRHPAAEGGTG